MRRTEEARAIYEDGISKCLNFALLDRRVVVRPRESLEWVRKMSEIGLFVGISSGAIMAGAVKCAATIPDGEEAHIVTIACDDGWKYLSTGAWTDDLDEVVERAKRIIYF